jgi:Ni,Fe-hydrogenase III small subunit
MFTLLRQLASIRRGAALTRPDHPQSLALRHVDAGSCNGCEHELGAITNPYHDLQRFGLDIVASPRHADILLVTGPVTTHMAAALRTAYNAMPEPRLVAALGDCALGCNIIGERSKHAGGLEHLLPVDIYIPGCPPTPATIAEHLLAGIATTTTSTLTRGARPNPPR